MLPYRFSVLTESQIQAIHEASLLVLRDTGVLVRHEGIRNLLADHGAVMADARIVRFPEQMVMDAVAVAGKKYLLHGRDSGRIARFGYGDQVLMSSPGQFAWIDSVTGQSREATLEDVRQAIRLGDALPQISIVGSMGQPREVPETYREVVLTAELVKGSTKPTRSWVYNGRTAAYVLEIFRTIAGGEKALRERPMTESFLEPISPLQLPKNGLDAVIEFVRAGQPISIGPMAMVAGSGPATLAGTLAQENAEILSAVVVIQALGRGTPVLYGGIPHILDPRTTLCSFGSPEQALMGVAMTQMGKFYGFPVYINVGLTDAKLPDAQAGIEKGISLMLGVAAGADMFGHAGICGADHGASLEWLLLDNEVMEYVKRVQRGFEVTPQKLAAEVIHRVGPAGNYLADEHTVANYRQELWLSGPVWTRQAWGTWEKEGRLGVPARLRQQVNQILEKHQVPPLDGGISREVDRIVAAAKKELANAPG